MSEHGDLTRVVGAGHDVVPGAHNDEGWDNWVQFAQVDGVEWVFRSPRRPEVEPELDHERRILDLVGSRLPVAVPQWRIDERLDGQRVIGYPRLPGVPAGIDAPDGDGFTFFLPVPPPPAFTRSLGPVLAALHGIATGEVSAAIGPPVSARAALGRRLQNLAATWSIRYELRAWWDAVLADDRLWPQDLRLVHGDVHPGHILIDNGYAVVGLIDWTDAGWDDPAQDFVDTRAAFGPDTTQRLIDAYARAGGTVEESLPDRILTRHALAVTMAATFGLDTGRDDILALARRRLDHQADRLAAGLPPV